MPTRIDLGVLLIAAAGLLLLGIGMFDGDLVDPVIRFPNAPADATLTERIDEVTRMSEDVTVDAEAGINEFSNLGRGLVILPLLAGFLAVLQIVRRRGVPSRTIGEFAVVTTLVAGFAILVRLTVSPDSGGPLGALARLLGADRGTEVALTIGGRWTVAALLLMFVGGLLARGIGRRGLEASYAG